VTQRHVAIKLVAQHRHQRRREFNMARSGGGHSPSKAASTTAPALWRARWHQAKLFPLAGSAAFVKDLRFHVPCAKTTSICPPAGAVQPGVLRLVVGSFSPGWPATGPPRKGARQSRPERLKPRVWRVSLVAWRTWDEQRPGVLRRSRAPERRVRATLDGVRIWEKRQYVTRMLAVYKSVPTRISEHGTAGQVAYVRGSSFVRTQQAKVAAPRTFFNSSAKYVPVDKTIST
jgi:hypothetical protein